MLSRNQNTITVIIFSFFLGSTVQSKAESEYVPTIVDLILSDSIVVDPPAVIFGATLVPESARPTRSWITVFDGVSPVAVSGSLQTAIDDCVSVCVIEVDQIDLNDTVYINQTNIKLLGKVGNKITFSASATGSMFLIETGAENIIIEDLNIDGRVSNSGKERDPDVIGISVDGDSIANVQLIGNHIHHLDGKEGAHGIAVFGSGASEQTAISNIIVEGNQLNDLRTGFSESIVVNGNVKNWEIIGNSVTDVNNIAIDAIGGEGTSPTRNDNGRIVPGIYDAARFGFIQNNIVTNMSTLSNPAYGSTHSFAAGIYIDGGHNILISGNTITNTPWAFEVGAENCVSTNHITIENNTSSLSRFGDLLIGGYAATGYFADTGINCDPLTSNDNAEGHGYTRFNTVKNNNFTSTSVLENLIETTLRVLNTIIIESEGNVMAVNEDGVVTGDQNSIRITE